MGSAQFTDRYQEILEGQTELICRYMPDGRLSYVNEAYSRYYNKDRGELLNRNFFPNVPSEDLPAIRQRIAALTQGNTVVDLEHRVILPDGQVRWQCWTHRAILDPSGEIVEYQAVGRDITPQKLREHQYDELLLSSRQRLKEVNCLYAITEVLTTPHQPLAEVAQAVVDLLPNAFQYPEITCARLVLLGRDCRTKNYANGVWRQTIDIIVQGEWLGFLEISYLAERPMLDSGPFLTAESVLLQEIVKRLHQVVERSRAEEKIRSLASFPNECPNPVMRVSYSGEVLFANTASAPIVANWEREDGPLLPDGIRAVAWQALKEGTPRQLQIDCKGQRYFLCFAPVAEAAYLNVFGYDVTEFTRAEADLREREAEYHRIFDAAPDALLIVGADDRILRGNAQACAMFRLSPEMIAGLPVYELAAPGIAQWLGAFSSIENDGERRWETRCRRADGDIIDVEIAAHRCDTGGRPYILAAFRDVSERKVSEEALRRSEEDFARFSGCLEHLVHERTLQVEQVGRAFQHEKSMRRATLRALQESETRLRDVFNGMHDGGWILEPRGADLVFVDFNQAAQRMEKITREDVIGRNLLEVFPWIRDRGLDEAVQRVRELGLSENFAVTFRRDGIDYAWREFHLFSIPTGEIVICYEDVSARKMVEAELRQSHKNEAIGQLAGGIAHDFNNILTGILGYAQLLETGFMGHLPAIVEPSTGLRYVQEVIKAGFRAQDLVQQILTFSRRSNVEKKLLHLPPLVKETVMFLRSSLPTTIKITCSVDEVEAAVLAEPTHIHQILMNLCGNAADALTDRCGNIEVSLEEYGRTQPVGDDPGSPSGQILLRVRDDGPGMSSDVLERIFEPYFTTKPVGKGTGLGLSVALGIVESLGGRIEVESAVGRGSEFRVLLPSAGQAIATAPNDVSVPILSGSGRILFVDDEAAIVESCRIRLEAAGFEVLTAASGPEALELFCVMPERIDVVVTDESMPGMPGSELAAHLRAIRPVLPIILCSGYQTCATADKVRVLDIDAFLMKPFTAQQLAAAILKAQARAGGGVDAATGAATRREKWSAGATCSGRDNQRGEVGHGVSIF